MRPPIGAKVLNILYFRLADVVHKKNTGDNHYLKILKSWERIRTDTKGVTQ